MTYRIAKNGDVPMRHNDGSMVIMLGDRDDDDARPALLVPMIVQPKRGQGWCTADPEQEDFAQRVVDLLNGAPR